MRKKYPIGAICIWFFLSCSLFENENSFLIGKLVYTAKDNQGTNQVYIYSEIPIPKHTQLTFFENNGAFEPSFSPDGAHIVFTRYNHRSSGLYYMNSDGTDLKPLYFKNNPEAFAFAGSFPKWSPLGDKILFDGCTHCIANISYYDFTKDTLVTLINDSFGNADYPSWAPDGESIVFVSDREYINLDSARYRRDLYSINIDGTELNRLTFTGEATFPTWNPNGKSIAFEWNIRGNEVYLLELEGHSIRKIETVLQTSGMLRWNKSGDRLIIGGRRENNGPEFIFIDPVNSMKELYSINLEGINLDYILDWDID